MSFDAIDDAFHYISNAPAGERSAVVQRSTGRVFLASRAADFDERPPGSADDPDFVSLPRRHELDPGQPLLLAFIQQHCPEEQARFAALFARPGGFRNAKDQLRRLGLLELWQVHEAQQLTALLRQWCQTQGLEV